MVDRFQNEFESIELRFRSVFERLVAEGHIGADDADDLSDVLDSIDSMDDDEFAGTVERLLKYRVRG